MIQIFGFVKNQVKSVDAKVAKRKKKGRKEIPRRVRFKVLLCVLSVSSVLSVSTLLIWFSE